MSEFIIVDNDVLSALSQEAVNYNPTAMNVLLIPGTTVVITSTVYGEATGFAATNEYSAFRKNWLDENIEAGNIIFEETPAFPTGVPDAGELSMLEVGTIRYTGNSVTYVSNDNLFTDMGAAGFNAVNVIPGQTHNTGQGLLFKSLTEGGMSLLEYQVSSYNLQDTTNESPILTQGASAVSTDGIVFFLSPAGLIAQQPVRRQGFWNQWRPKLRESLAHLFGLIMRRAGGDASVALRASFV